MEHGAYEFTICMTVVMIIQTMASEQKEAITHINLMGFFPMTGYGWTGGGAMLPATEMALRDVNARADILPDYHINFNWSNTQCHPGISVNKMFEALYAPPVKHMIIGPACSTEAILQAQASHIWNISHLSYSASSMVLSDKKLYPKFYRTVTDSISNIGKIALIRLFGWTRVATINVALTKFSSIINDFVQITKGTEISIISQEIFLSDPYLRLLNLKKKDARIIVAEGYVDSGRAILCAAYKLGLYGPKIVWIFPGLYSPFWWRLGLEDIPCTQSQMDLAAEGHFLFGFYMRISENVTGFAGLTVSEFYTRLVLEPSYSDKFQRYEFLSPVMYDIIWASALALNCTDNVLKSMGHSKTLDAFEYSDGDIGDIMSECIQNVSFDGISAHIVFNGFGEPLRNMKIFQVQDTEMVTIGRYVVEEEPHHFEWFNEGIIWRGGIAPRDSTLVSKVETIIPEFLYILMSCLSAAGIIVAVAFFIFNVAYRKHVYIKLSSPMVNNVLLLGCILSYSTVFMQDHGDERGYTLALCKVRRFTFTIGFTMAFGAMFSKTWRVYKIFCNRRLLQIKIRDLQLIGIVVLLVGVILAILVVWEIVDPLYIQILYLENQIFVTGNDAEVHPYQRECISAFYNHFLWTICILEGVLLAFGAFLAFETRKVKIEALNDAHHIGFCLYNVIILSALGLTLSILLSHQTALVYGIMSGFIIIGTTATQLVVFIPKVYRVFYPHTIEMQGQSRHPELNQSNTKSSRLAAGGSTQNTSGTQDTNEMDTKSSRLATVGSTQSTSGTQDTNEMDTKSSRIAAVGSS